jgi:hypothetical protein
MGMFGAGILIQFVYTASYAKVDVTMTPNGRRVRYVLGPDGIPLSTTDLPAPDTGRWVTRRKAIVVAAVKGGLLTMEEACTRYSLSVEEYLSWQAAVDQHGLAGLRTTKLQDYRAEMALKLGD